MIFHFTTAKQYINKKNKKEYTALSMVTDGSNGEGVVLYSNDSGGLFVMKVKIFMKKFSLKKN